eukprot:2865771-Pleurochrysis_carterae.AAC.1
MSHSQQIRLRLNGVAHLCPADLALRSAASASESATTGAHLRTHRRTSSAALSIDAYSGCSVVEQASLEQCSTLLLKGTEAE